MGMKKVEVTDLIPIEHGLILSWQGNIGFGEYTIFTDSEGHMLADSEHMDKDDDKEFLRSLFDSIVEQIKVVG